MVNRCRLTFAAGLALCVASFTFAGGPPTYQIGDTVTADVAAPELLTVVNSNATQVLQHKEALKLPWIFIYHPEAANEVEQSFRGAFASARNDFSNAMAAVYQRKRLNPQWLGSPRFTTLAATFKQQHQRFPQLDELMELWALGKPDDAIEDALVARLREAMQRHIRPDTTPADFKIAGPVRLIAASNDTANLTADALKKIGLTIPRTNLLALNRVRSAFQQLSAPEKRHEAKFLSSFLKPNCLLEEELTANLRAQHVKALAVADHYDAGQIIAKRGQKVDAKILGALNQIKPFQPELQPKESSPAPIAWLYQLNPWWWMGIVGVVAGSVVVAWRALERKKPVAMLPARVAGGGETAGIVSCPSCDETIIVPAEAVENLSANAAAWQQRAIAAEQRAERAHAAIRAGVLPQLADWLKQRFVRGLVSDREQMFAAQKSAALEMAELERRLDELHTPLQDRLRAYEQRIAELEKLLAAKGEENRELLRAKIEMTRQHLKNQRQRNRLEFN